MMFSAVYENDGEVTNFKVTFYENCQRYTCKNFILVLDSIEL